VPGCPTTKEGNQVKKHYKQSLLAVLVLLAGTLEATVANEFSFEHIELYCDEGEPRPSSTIESWMVDDKVFNLSYTELGWHDWSSTILHKVGFPRSTGIYSYINVIGLPKVSYDTLSWAEPDMNSDGLSDLLIITALLEGTDVLRNTNTIFLFCNETSSKTNFNYRACGFVNYGRYAPVESLTFPWYGIDDRVSTQAKAIESNRAFFVTKGTDGIQHLVAVSSAKEPSGRRNYHWDSWGASPTGLSYSQPCR
jgi:hypothetical protein